MAFIESTILMHKFENETLEKSLFSVESMYGDIRIVLDYLLLSADLGWAHNF